MKVIIEADFSLNNFEENIRNNTQADDLKEALGGASSFKKYLLLERISEELKTKDIELFV